MINFATVLEHHDRVKVAAAQKEIAELMNLSVETVKKKLHSLRTSYCNERRRILKKKSGQGVSNEKRSKKYEALHFLDCAVTPRKTESNMVSESIVLFDN